MKKMLRKKNMDLCHLEKNIQYCSLKVCYLIFLLQRGKEKLHTKIAMDNVIVMLFFEPHPQLTSSRVATYVKALTPKNVFRNMHLKSPCNHTFARVPKYPFVRILLLTTKMQWLNLSSVNSVTLVIISVILIQKSTF